MKTVKQAVNTIRNQYINSLEIFVYFQGNDLQRPIEEAFLSTPYCYKFKIAEQDYVLHFLKMEQENLRYGTKRQVRRRPGEFRSGAEILEIRR